MSSHSEQSSYESYCLDGRLDRLQEWVEDKDNLSDVEEAILDYQAQVLEPTGVKLMDWDVWSKEHRHNFLDWLDSKAVTEDYGWGKWLEGAWASWYEGAASRYADRYEDERA